MRANSSGLFQMDPNNILPLDAAGAYTAGDYRFSQTTMLALIYSLFTRFHNVIATNLQAVNPHWTNNETFFESRRLSIALYQHIIYCEWLPLVIGKYRVDLEVVKPTKNLVFE